MCVMCCKALSNLPRVHARSLAAYRLTTVCSTLCVLYFSLLYYSIYIYYMYYIQHILYFYLYTVKTTLPCC